MALWGKNQNMPKKLLEFLNEENCEVDKKLIETNCIVISAYCEALHKANIITLEELRKIQKCLEELSQKAKNGELEISLEEEDSHTKIEEYLTSKLGETGKKIHLGKSRNDEALAVIRLYSKVQLKEIGKALENLIVTLRESAKTHKNTAMPGYTHMRKAMPTSFGYWCDGFAMLFGRDLEAVNFVSKQIDYSPLGTAAGYGSPIELEWREMAEELGFSGMEENGIAAQNSRGKEAALIGASLSQIILDVNKLATDLMLWSTEEFGFVSLPKGLTTGSSIMPQKKNPDVLEILRAKASSVISMQVHITISSLNLPSGYNRDVQETKKPLLEAFEISLNSLEVTRLILQNIKVNADKMKEAIKDEILTAKAASEMALKGTPFREAYSQVKSSL